jgi:hypothetical protein
MGSTRSWHLALMDLLFGGLMGDKVESTMVVCPLSNCEIQFIGDFFDVTYGVAVCYMCPSFLLCKMGKML